MQSLSQYRAGENGGDRAAILAGAGIRRNGIRQEPASLVPRRRLFYPKPFGQTRHWSATKVQTRLTTFRPVTCVPASTRVRSGGARSSEARRSRRIRIGVLLPLLIVLTGILATAQSHAPVVTMNVTLPDGRTQELVAAESGLATLNLKDGTEYGFRPTIQDSTPWNRIIVTIFRTATTHAPTQLVGEVELTRGGPAVDSKTTPSFKVAVPKVSPPATQTRSTS